MIIEVLYEFYWYNKKEIDSKDDNLCTVWW